MAALDAERWLSEMGIDDKSEGGAAAVGGAAGAGAAMARDAAAAAAGHAKTEL
jgi:hypothetical protein